MTKIDELNQQAKDEILTTETFISNSLAQIEALKIAIEDARSELQKRITALYSERDGLALQIKLENIPLELREKHPVCLICGMEMRPFHFATGAWRWGCPEPNHDMLEV